MLLTQERRNTLNARLTSAESAYSRLMMGQSVREMVDQNGERITFTAANASLLAAYIRDLKTELGLMGARRPLGFLF